MEYEWYADLFFLEEAYRDILIVWLAAVIGRKRTSFWRVISAGIAGGICSTAFTFFEIFVRCVSAQETAVFVLYEAAKILISGIAMVTAAYSKISLKRRSGTKSIQKKKDVSGYQEWMIQGIRKGKDLGILLLSAGIIQSGISFLREWCFLTGWKNLAFMGAFCAGMRFFAAAVVKRPAVGNKRYEVRLFLAGTEKTFTAMADSGNRLVEPVTGKPVTIIAKEDAEIFAGKENGIFMIPYRAVGTKHGMLPGILMDRMEVSLDGNTVCITRPIVAVTTEPLFFEKNFNMILPESLAEQAEHGL